MVYCIETNEEGRFPHYGETVTVEEVVWGYDKPLKTVLGKFKVMARGDCQVRQVIPSFIYATLVASDEVPIGVYPGRVAQKQS